MNVEISFVGVTVGVFPSTGQSVAQETGRCWCTTVRDGSTVGDLMKRLGVPEAEIGMILVNGRHADRHTVLQDGDAVALSGQVAGD